MQACYIREGKVRPVKAGLQRDEARAINARKTGIKKRANVIHLDALCPAKLDHICLTDIDYFV